MSHLTNLLLISLLLGAAPAASASRASVLYDSSPPALSFVDLEAGNLIRSGRTSVYRLPAPHLDRCRAQAVDPDGGLWVATDHVLMRLIETRRGMRVDRRFRLKKGQRRPVDIAVWSQAGRTLVALAMSPAAPETPTVVVIDGERGDVLDRYDAIHADMSAIWSLHHDAGGLLIFNRRREPVLGEQGGLTRLVWDGDRLAETGWMYFFEAGDLRGDAALSSIGPGLGIAISNRFPISLLVETAGPGTHEPFPELEWAESAVAAGGDPAHLAANGETNLFLIDAAQNEILDLNGLGTWAAATRRELTSLGIRVGVGTHLVLDGEREIGLLSAPASDSLVFFDLETLGVRSIVRTEQEAPFSILRLPEAVR